MFRVSKNFIWLLGGGNGYSVQICLHQVVDNVYIGIPCFSLGFNYVDK